MDRVLFALRYSWLLIYLGMWGLLIRALRPLISVQRLSALAVRLLHPLPASQTAVIRALAWLDHLGIFGSQNQCLVRALVSYRALRQCRTLPVLYIGFARPDVGHAWVELGNIPVLENPDTIATYRPLLTMDSQSGLLHQIGGSA